MSWAARTADGVRHPVRWLRDLCAGQPVFPLLVLFGLNAVDELDRTAFGILLPEIRDHFDLDLSTALSLVALSAVAALALQVPIAQWADRSKRVPLAVVGALTWAVFSGMTGLATGIVILTIARSGSSIGKAVIDPTHNSLLADYYPIEARARIYSFHRAANAVGAFVGPLTAGALAYAFGWRAPFLIFVIPTVVLAILALRLREPVRGNWERRASGASEEVIATEETAPSFAESWRTVHKVRSLRRIWVSLPFLAVSLIGFVTLASLLYEQEFGLDERARGVAAAVAEPFQLAGLVIGARIATKRYIGDVRGLIRFLASVSIGAGLASALFALSPNIVIAVAINCVVSASLAMIAPGILTSLSLAIPPRARSTGFSVASLWIIPGLAVLPLIGWIADTWSIRVGMLVMLPLFFVGSLVLRSTADVIDEDIAQVWQSAAARAEVLYDRRRGAASLLLLRGVSSGYDGRPVLHGVDLELAEGEVVALLGTNGAGKSTLLKTISGVVEADRGAVVFDGRDITHVPPNEIAALGVVQMPGGAGVFASLTVRENLQLAGWTERRDPEGVAAATEEALGMFPILAQRLDTPAGDLSGGQQQMLALSMSFIMRPRVLLVDELSLGLAPTVVGQLLPVIERLSAEGTTVVLVEQSVNVALTVAQRAYFMERGTIRFSGPTEELLARPDLLRSVFLAGAAGAEPAPSTNGDATGVAAAPSPVAEITTGSPMPAEADRAPVLRVLELSVSFGGIRAVDEVSFDVAPHEIVGVIGPNGAGKTTVFDLVSGFSRSTAGRVWLGDRELTELSPSARAAAGLGRSFQDARLYPELTVDEVLAISLERWVGSRSAVAAALRLPHQVSSEGVVTRRVDELVELMSLGPVRRHVVRELSTGTRRMVDLACLVAHRPTVILLDEPTSGIAQREVEALAPVVRRLRDEMGASLVIVEHDIPFLSEVCDRFVALDQGRVIATGPPTTVLDHPLVVESYLGTSRAAITRSGTRG
jgi:ABC-type branched-subunit amino acid transport system ATPase component/predicted MFS family arabinose efflux permease